jgi:hypothetical protein
MTRRHFVFILVLALLAGMSLRQSHLLALTGSPTTTVAVVYDPAELNARPELGAAWDAALVREGVPHEWISESDLALFDAAYLPRRFSAIVLPDGLARWIPSDLAGELQSFVRSGGTTVVVGDAGTVADDGHLLLDRTLGDAITSRTIRGRAPYVPAWVPIDQVIRRTLFAIAGVPHLLFSPNVPDSVLATQARFERRSSGFTAALSNPNGLQYVTFAVPRSWKPVSTEGTVETATDAMYRFYTVVANTNQLQATFSVR